MKQNFKCLHCGFEYTAPDESKENVRERVCPKCQSNSVRRLSSKDSQG